MNGTPRTVVAAMSFAIFQNWCRQHGINPRSVKFVGGWPDLVGHHNHHVVFLHGYERHPVFLEGAHARIHLMQGSAAVYYEWDVPIVEKGRIVGWK